MIDANTVFRSTAPQTPLLTAYQEELLSFDELRVRMPPLRQREQAMQAELQAINHQTAGRAAYLQLAETLTAFLERLRANADTLDIGQRQRIMRLLVKEVIVGKDLITIKHSIPGQTAPTGGNPQAPKSPLPSTIRYRSIKVILCVRGVISPLLANIYLDQLDKELEKRELSFCRYADDITIYVSSERSAKRVLESLTAWIAKHLKLSVNQDKSGTGRPWERQFLSFQITEDGEIAIAQKGIQGYKANVRNLWNARQICPSNFF